MLSDFSFPLPVPTPDNQGFWDACKGHRLVIQRCLKCQGYQHPPRPMCHRCSSPDLQWAESRGRGRVYTYTVTHQPVHPALKDRAPWNVVIVEMEEGVRMVSHLIDCPDEEIRIDMPVEVAFVDVAQGVALPYFRPVGEAKSS